MAKITQLWVDAVGRVVGPQAFDRLAKRLTRHLMVHPRLRDPSCRRLRRDAERPVIVGPWMLEVGFELLYWIPYLRRELRKARVAPRRVVAVSRGGVADWYRGIADEYVEVLDLMTTEAFSALNRDLTDTGGGRKPISPTATERRLVKAVAERLGHREEDVDFVLPSAMYGAFRHLWRMRFGGEQAEKLLDAAPLHRPDPLPELAGKEPYVAVKLYDSLYFEPTAENRVLAAGLLEALARDRTVVLLNNAAVLDDHANFLDAHPNVVDASRWLDPRDNLGVQSRIVAGADRLVCTYGGFAYLGPLLGVPTVAFYTKPTFVSTHLSLALRMCDTIQAPPLAAVPFSPAVLDLLRGAPADRSRHVA